MRVVIHGGLHKTGSTSFQKSALRCRRLLRQVGIFYSRVGLKGEHFNHNLWIDDAFYENDFSWLNPALRKARRRVGENGVMLLSAENLEYFAHTDFPVRLEQGLLEAGASTVAWVFVFRDPVEYHASLYGQVAAGDAATVRPVLDFHGSAVLAAKWGSLDFSSFHQVHRFVFEYQGFVADLRRRLIGAVVPFSFEEMVLDALTPGDPLIAWLTGGRSTLTQLLGDRRLSMRRSRANQGLGPEQIERLYLRRFLGEQNRDDLLDEVVLDRLVQHRLRSRELAQPRVQELFGHRFSGWRSVLEPRPAFL
jgi:hypothetical protein